MSEPADKTEALNDLYNWLFSEGCSEEKAKRILEPLLSFRDSLEGVSEPEGIYYPELLADPSQYYVSTLGIRHGPFDLDRKSLSIDSDNKCNAAECETCNEGE